MVPRWLKKRSGQRVRFDIDKLRVSLVAAADAAGEVLLADEICEMIGFFLAKRFPDAVPTTEDLQDLVERILLETSHSPTAAVYAERTRSKARSRNAVRVSAETLLGSDGELPDGPQSREWSEGQIAQSLTRHCEIPPDVADDVAAAVERRVLALGLERVTPVLIREVVQLELHARGMVVRLPRPSAIAIPARSIRRILSADTVRRQADESVGSQLGAEERIGREVLHRYAIERALPERCAHSHREGRIHIAGLGQPLRLATGALALDHLKSLLGDSAPKTAAELAVAVASTLRRASRFHSQTIGLPFADVFFAPYARGREATVLRDLREAYRILTAASTSVRLTLHLGPVPAALKDRAPIGRGGKRWRTGYGDLEVEIARARRMLLTIAAEESSRVGSQRPRLVLSIESAEQLPPQELLASLDAVALKEAGLGLPLSAGLADGGALAGPVRESPFVAGALGVVALNCAGAAHRVGPGDEPRFRALLFEALDDAIAAFETSLEFVQHAVYQPRLPLWTTSGASAAPAVAPAEQVVCVLGLIGLAEALAHLLGESPSQNPAVREVATSLAKDLADEARRRGHERGLSIRLEEPQLRLAARRLADHDLGGPHRDVARRTLVTSGSVRAYGAGFALPMDCASAVQASLDQLYRPLGLAPWVRLGLGSAGRERLRALLDAVAAVES